MKLPKPPNYKKDAKITARGWRHPRTNELLVPKKFTQAEIDAYNAGPDPIIIQAPVEEVQPTVEVAAVFEDQQIVVEVEPPVNFADMTKLQLEEWARENLDIELDRRLTKVALIEQIESAMTSK